MIARVIVWSARNLLLVLFGTGFAAAAGIYALVHLPLDAILRYGLPDAAAARAFLRDLLSDEKASEAAEAWPWILARGWADGKLASEYAALL